MMKPKLTYIMIDHIVEFDYKSGLPGGIHLLFRPTKHKLRLVIDALQTRPERQGECFRKGASVSVEKKETKTTS